VKLHATGPVPEDAARGYPHQIWELAELVMAGCPPAALKEFRGILIDRYNRANPDRLTAGQADDAISGAKTVLRTGRLPAAGRKARPEEPETLRASLARARWYLRHGLPAVFARAEGYAWTDEELQFVAGVRAAGAALTFLEWNDTGVDRVGGPPC
jgi:hypothetical protein